MSLRLEITSCSPYKGMIVQPTCPNTHGERYMAINAYVHARYKTYQASETAAAVQYGDLTASQSSHSDTPAHWAGAAPHMVYF